jgi:hypothetical protein
MAALGIQDTERRQAKINNAKTPFRSATIAEIRQRAIFNNECTICGGNDLSIINTYEPIFRL